MKKKFTMSVCLTLSLMATAQVKVDFDFGRRGPVITSDHYGVFFEELSHAGDGGLYAEIIQNRSFEDDANTPVHWTTVGSATMALTTDHMMNPHQQHALRVDVTSAGGGIRNDGYWGISAVSGDTYTVRFWIRSDEEWEGRVTATLRNSEQQDVGHTRINIKATDTWKQYTMKVKATGGDGGGFFDLTFSQSGSLMVDMVSVMPPTFMNRENGMRRDLAQMFADLRPAFFRFPGGCYSEGTFDRGSDCRYIWKHSVGPQEERIPLWNSKWGYTVTQGQGIYEYLQFCEDIGAIPMYVLNVGLGHGWVHDKNDLGEYIQEALDVIEYANGDTNTTWGRKRAEAGHPEPFNMKYIEIGNENANWFFDNNTDQSQEYFERYIQFYTAIHEKYPDMVIIGNVQAWGTDYPTWRSNHPVDVLDEHYYRPPVWFMQHYNHYDNYPRSGPTIYVGEYSANSENGWYGTMYGAACEAIFMQGMENNSDVVRMASYSEPYAHNNDYRWRAMMFYDNRNSFGTPSYYAQKMFSNNVGHQNIKWEETDNGASSSTTNRIGVGTWSTSSTYSQLKVVNADGEVVFDAAGTTAADWTNENGQWSLADGTLTQATTSGTRSSYTIINAIPTDTMTYTLKAKKVSGAEGFLVIFDFDDVDNYTWWAIGGWGNVQHGVEQSIGGVKTTLAATPGSVTAGREYDIRIEKAGRHVCCYLDDVLIHEFDMLTPTERHVYVSASVTDETGDSYIKLVNPHGEAHDLHLTFSHGTPTSATAEVLSSSDPNLENTLDAPRAVYPRTATVSINPDGSIDYTAQPYSINILRLRVADITIDDVTQAALPNSTVSYSFSHGLPTDDAQVYEGQLHGGATILSLDDNNRVLYTGPVSESGYMQMPNNLLSDALGTADQFTISVNVNHNIQNNLNRYCWIYAFAQNTDRYVALVNSPGNGDWYYEINNNGRQTSHSAAPLCIGRWHNVTYTQSQSVGRIYIDGQLLGRGDVTHLPRDIADAVTQTYICRSPFSGDALMEGMYVDDFQIFDTALTDQQVSLLALRATQLLPPPADTDYSARYDLQELIDLVQPICEHHPDDTLADSLAKARQRLAAADINSLRSGYTYLSEAYDRYVASQTSLLDAGRPADLTFLLINPSFISKDRGWQGTPFTAISSQTAEMWNKPFDFNQTIAADYMAAGTYALRVCAYYRAGDIAAAYTAWQNASPLCLNAQLYIGDQSVSIVNFFADAEHYTYSPYTYPDNLTTASQALNAAGSPYADNEVRIQLVEPTDLRLGIRKLQPLAADWTAFDRFQLLYLGDIETSIDPTLTPVAAYTQQCFSLDGIPLKHLRRGINIIRQADRDGVVQTSKIWVR